MLRTVVLGFLFACFSRAAISAPHIAVDSTFGVDGVAKVDYAFRMALTPEGKILALGRDQETLVLYRYTRSGSPDLSFGTQGHIRLFANSVRFNPETATSLLVATDGRIYLAGLIGEGCPTFDVPCNASVLARYLPNGDLDTTFGTNGLAQLSIGQYGPYRQIVYLAFSSNGSVVAAENASSQPFRGGPPVVVKSRIERFGANGTSLASWPLAVPNCQPSAAELAVQPDDAILVTIGGGSSPNCLARYTPAGTLDSAFGSSGTVGWEQYVPASGPNELVLNPNGKVMLSLVNLSGNHNVIRFTPNGQLDTAFGVPNGAGIAPVNAQAIAVACGGKFVGGTVGQDSFYKYVGLTRYNSNGSPDLTASDTADGIVSKFVSFISQVSDVLVRDDGEVIVQVLGYDGSAGPFVNYLVAYRQLDCQHPTDATLSPVVEYYNASMNHYFVSDATADMEELDSGRLKGWQRTGYTFATTPVVSNPVCRFYIPPAYGDSHFFSASSTECNDVRTRFPQFVFETSDAFRAQTPDVVTGICPAATPVRTYRVWNAKPDTNHRYVTDKDVRDAMVASGWIAEGYGPDAVAMCTKQQ